MDTEEDVSKLKKCIELITHSGLYHLDTNLFRDIRHLCRKSDNLVQQAFISTCKQLQKKHSQIRFCSWLLCSELFSRSQTFRKNVIDNLQLFIKLTIDVELPPPKVAAAKLRANALNTISEWNKNYGDTFKELKLCFNYLKNCKGVNFSEINQELAEESAQRELVLRQHESIRVEKNKKLEEAIEDSKIEIENLISSTNNCLDLLLPTPENFFISLENNEDTNISLKEEDYNLRQFGVQRTFNLNLNVSEQIFVKKTDENLSIIDNLNDNVRLIRKRFYPKIRNWINLSTKFELNNALKYLIGIKEKLDAVLKKLDELKIEGFDEDSTDDEDFVEVVSKADYEPEVVEPQPSTSKAVYGEREKLLEIAPKVPFDVDLYHWEDANLKPPTLISTNLDCPKFWSSSNVEEITEIPAPGGLESLRTRVIEFSGKFEPVTWTCRARLPSGRLCPRQDRFKCPFHGPIVERNELGEPLRKCESTSKDPESCSSTSSVPDWQDPQLLADLQAATGLDLKMPDKTKTKKGKRKKKPMEGELNRRNLPGLIDIRKKSTTRSRLSKKIFNRSSLKRVAAINSKLDYRRHREKFEDQFNYTHNTS